MQLSLLETDFWIGGALRAAGLPYGALKPAIRMVQWAEMHDGHGFRHLLESCRDALPCDPDAIEVASEADTDILLDAAEQSSLLVGPAAFDFAMAKAEAEGRGLARLRNIADTGWLPGLVESAAARGLTAALTCQAAGSESGCAVLAIPDAVGSPWWMEMACATPLHDVLMEAGPLPGLSEIGRNLATRASGQQAGAALICLRLSAAEQSQLRQIPMLLGQAAGARIIGATDYAERWRRVRELGFEIGEEDWRVLSALALTTVIDSSEASRSQAGADD